MSESPRILLVEDSREDFEAVQRGLRAAGVEQLKWCESGDDALDYLYQRGAYAESGSAPRPDVVLLDLNLPGTDGREVLAQIKRDPALRSIPVVVLTTSSDHADVARCYREGANSYLRKPSAGTSPEETFRRFRRYWFDVALLPTRACVARLTSPNPP